MSRSETVRQGRPNWANNCQVMQGEWGCKLEVSDQVSGQASIGYKVPTWYQVGSNFGRSNMWFASKKITEGWSIYNPWDKERDSEKTVKFDRNRINDEKKVKKIAVSSKQNTIWMMLLTMALHSIWSLSYRWSILIIDFTS